MMLLMDDADGHSLAKLPIDEIQLRGTYTGSKRTWRLLPYLIRHQAVLL